MIRAIKLKVDDLIEKYAKNDKEQADELRVNIYWWFV